MAPIQPTHRTSNPTKSILKQTSKSTTSTTTSKPTSKSIPLFPTNKLDKRRIKHASLMSKVTKSSSSAHIKNAKRQRRPNKKLVTTLDGLADALPSATDGTEPAAGVSVLGTESVANNVASQVNLIHRKSMKSKPGAMKRQQKLDNQEKERWAKNLAQLSVGVKDESAGGDAQMSSGTSGAQDRWAALRGFIGQTLEKRADVVASKG